MDSNDEMKGERGPVYASSIIELPDGQILPENRVRVSRKAVQSMLAGFRKEVAKMLLES